MTETPIKNPTPVRPSARPAAPPVPEGREPMDANNRCDKCGAQAYVRVHVTTTSSLEFCGHHWIEIRGPKFDKYEIQDEMHLITKERDTQ